MLYLKLAQVYIRTLGTLVEASKKIKNIDSRSLAAKSNAFAKRKTSSFDSTKNYAKAFF